MPKQKIPTGEHDRRTATTPRPCDAEAWLAIFCAVVKNRSVDDASRAADNALEQFKRRF